MGNNNEPWETVMEKEFRDALMILEEDNVITQVGHKKAPTIRFMQDV